MARGQFGETLTAASNTAGKASRNPAIQWTAIITAVALAGVEGYLSRDASHTLEQKSAKSEDATLDAIEANAKAISAGAKGLEALQADREKLEQEVRKSVNALNAVARQHEARINALSVSVMVEARLRERRESDERHAMSAREREERDNANSDNTVMEPAEPSPEVAALVSPKDVGKDSAAAVETLKGYAQPRLVPRVWNKPDATQQVAQ